MNPDMTMGSLAPVLILGGGAVLVLMTALFSPARAAGISRLLALASLILAAFCLASASSPLRLASLDGSSPSRVLGLIILATALLSGMGHRRSVPEARLPEYLSLLLLSCAGLLGMTAASDFLLLFVSVEVASVSFYILTGFLNPDRRAQEAALKYFILGSIASATMVLGLALVGGSSPQVLDFRMAPGQDPALYLPGCAALLVGLFFKVGAAPFHWWAPDAYQAAPAPASAFMSVAPKIAAGAALLRWAERGLDDSVRLPVLAAVAAVALISITLGNLGALLQDDFRRFLAYSSVANAGYLLLAPLCAPGRGWPALAAYGAAYAAMNLGAFLAADVLERWTADGSSNGFRMDQFGGLIHAAPVLGALLCLNLASLMGIPFTAGFLGKLGLFQAAWGGGWQKVVIYAALMTVFAAAYYLRPLAKILIEPVSRVSARAPEADGLTKVSLALAAGVTLLLGILPNLLLRFVLP